MHDELACISPEAAAGHTRQCSCFIFWFLATFRFVPPVEVRQYDPFLVAEVTFSKEEAPEMKAALSGGFRAIAGFIFDSKARQQCKCKVGQVMSK